MNMTRHQKHPIPLQHHIKYLTVRALTFSPVSWQYGSSHPSGEVAEKKAEGEIAIQSKRGNTIKKKAEPGDPAVHITRPGNDVVKNQSELEVDEKANGAADADVEPEEVAKEDEAAPKTGGKRKADAADAEEEEEPKKKARGRPKKSDAPAVKKAPAAKKAAKVADKKEDKPADTTEEPAKKSRGRPKKEGGAEKAPAKAKKTKSATKANGTGVGSRTRSKN